MEWSYGGILQSSRSIDPNRRECVEWIDFPKHQYGTASIYLGSDRVLDKPIILVQPYIISLDDSVYTESTFYNQTNPGGFLDRLRVSGYDIILYRYRDIDNGVIYNADGLKVLVERLQRTDSVSSMSVVGLSMGGVVARYALADIERNSSLEKVATYISYDAPHLGANFPKQITNSLARFYDKVDTWICGEVDSCREARRNIQAILNKQSTKTFTQLIIDGRYNRFNHLTLMNQLNQIGHVNSIPTLAITNGAETRKQGYPETKLTTRFKYHREWFQGGSVWFNVYTNPDVDNEPGGYANFYQFYSNEIMESESSRVTVYVNAGQKHSFVSTQSAIAGSENNFTSILTYPTANEPHMHFNYEKLRAIREWLETYQY
ncbi:lipase family alpha/beta hydrolase [Ferrimonas balearica]|uniref:lipase family alpha/beta hydrolase n=1 Tax=Ferrimonas balearica TaxID=44012 RepID=UPI001C96D199|nr:putative lipase [Ferrimonas balearica]MBY6225369.1 putative lipase [Ferrimonas balearica]